MSTNMPPGEHELADSRLSRKIDLPLAHIADGDNGVTRSTSGPVSATLPNHYDQMPLQQLEKGAQETGNDATIARGQPVADPNEYSGILSSPGLCGNNSLLQRQDDVMNNFLQNLKEKMDENEEDNASQDKFLNDLISSKSRLQTQSHIDFSKSKQTDQQRTANRNANAGDAALMGSNIS